MDAGFVGGGGTTWFHWKNFNFIGKNLYFIEKKLEKIDQKMAENPFGGGMSFYDPTYKFSHELQKFLCETTLMIITGHSNHLQVINLTLLDE